VEEEVADLADRLGAFCDSIDSCHISVEQPTGESGERHWRLALSLRIFDESVRATTCRPTGADPVCSLASMLEEIYARAIDQMTQIGTRHHCSCAGPARHASSHCKECA
jgi:hypothetical protein